jgi:hypothetical protein
LLWFVVGFLRQGLDLQPRLAWNSQFSCLSHPSARITKYSGQNRLEVWLKLERAALQERSPEFKFQLHQKTNK